MGDLSPAEFAKTLTEEECMLLTLRDELYEGSWDNMLQDLRDRLKGKPYIFKLVNRIEEDIIRIEKLRQYEATVRPQYLQTTTWRQSCPPRFPSARGDSQHDN